MPDSSVPITPGSGANVDTRTQGNGDHREVVVLGDPTNTYVAEVGSSGGLAVKGAAFAPITQLIPAGMAGPGNSYNVSEAGNLTMFFKNSTGTAFTGSASLTFQQSDNGTDWAPLVVQRMDTGFVSSTHVFTAPAVNASICLNAALPGVTYVRVFCNSAPPAGGAMVVLCPGGMPFNPISGMQAVSRSPVNFYSASAVATSATETLLSLTSLRNGATVAATTTPAVVSAGKTLRVTSVTVAYIGTSTAGYCIGRLRVNTAGVVAVTSPLWRSIPAGTAAGATANSSGIVISQPAEGFDIPSGAGLGVTVQGYNALTATAVGYAIVEVVGYEY